MKMKKMKETACKEKPDQKQIPRILIAATGSGSGKTAISAGLLRLLTRRQMSVHACKCGPDYIDPMFHETVLGVASDNLDSYFATEDEINGILYSAPETHAVIEGVMGLYDGIHVSTLAGSCYEIAAMSKTPVLLVVDAKGSGRTILSVLKGILQDDEKHLIRGILFNRMSEGFYEKCRPAVEEMLQDGGFSQVRCLGAIPSVAGIGFESRHLGLKLPDEIEDICGKIDRMSNVLEEHCDIDALLAIMEAAPAIPAGVVRESEDTEVHSDGAAQSLSHGDFAVGTGAARPVLAVAKDEAFCFYYRRNLELLKDLGVSIRTFSPLHDTQLPPDAAGLYLGGGYPELHLEKLSANTSMLQSIRKALSEGMPSIAECGGFIYLHRTVLDREGRPFELVGAIEGSCQDTGHPVRFGYVEVAKKDVCAFSKSLAGMRGHEFHYFDSTASPDVAVKKPVTGQEWSALIADENRLWGFPHFYFPSAPDVMRGFVSAIRTNFLKN